MAELHQEVNLRPSLTYINQFLYSYNGTCEDLDNLDKERENYASNFGFVCTNKELLTYVRDAVNEHRDDKIATGWDRT